MPFWPFFMGAAFALTMWGLWRGAYVAPLLVFLGYVAMRGVIWGLDAELHEVAGCLVWLVVAFLLMERGAWVPGFFYALSGLAYPVLLLFGARLAYLSASAIVAEIFAISALGAIAGGLAGLAHSADDGARILRWLTAHSLGVAARS